MQSRVLPARPNLDHLRTEAKALLKSLRASDSAVKLTDAQRSLARQYGFPTWARLRAAVELARTATNGETEFLAAIQQQDVAWARHVLESNPRLPSASLHVAAAVGSAADVTRLVEANPSAINAVAGDPAAAPLLFLCYSPFHGESADRDASLLLSARTLVDAGADPNSRDGRYAVPALYAVTGMHNVPAIARILLEAGANPTDGESVFHAAERFHEDALALLLEFGVDLNHTGEWGNTPLYFLLLWHDADRDANVSRGIHWLLDHGADPNVPCGKERENSLHVAVRRGQSVRVVQLLLDQGATIEARRGDGLTAWRLAKRAAYDELVALLERAGARAEPLSPTDMLMAACGSGDAESARRLSSPALIASLPPSDQRMLGEAAVAGRTDQVHACIAAGFDANSTNGRGATALHEAAISGYSEIVSALLAAGAFYDVADPEHSATALGWATWGADFATDRSDGNYEETIRALLRAGARLRENEHRPSHAGARAALGLPDP